MQEIDNSWDDVSFESLPEKHKHEYYLTAGRIISYIGDRCFNRLAIAEDEENRLTTKVYKWWKAIWEREE